MGFLDPNEGTGAEGGSPELQEYYDTLSGVDQAVPEEPEFALSETEFQSELWQKFRNHLRRELSILRMENDNYIHEIDSTKIRSRIALIKEFLELGSPGSESDLGSLDQELIY